MTQFVFVGFCTQKGPVSEGPVRLKTHQDVFAGDFSAQCLLQFCDRKISPFYIIIIIIIPYFLFVSRLGFAADTLGV